MKISGALLPQQRLTRTVILLIFMAARDRYIIRPPVHPATPSAALFCSNSTSTLYFIAPDILYHPPTFAFLPCLLLTTFSFAQFLTAPYIAFYSSQLSASFPI